MQPTIYAGDHFVVTKWSFGYGRYSFAPLPFVDGRLFARTPERGDIVVFRPQSEPNRDFVKRVIGLPGDRVQMIDGVLHLNGEAVERDALGAASFRDGIGELVTGDLYREHLPNGASYVVLDRRTGGELDNTRVFVVPEGHVFTMGDDRDNSADSRVQFVGYVPMDNLVGEVVWIFPSSSSERLDTE